MSKAKASDKKSNLNQDDPNTFGDSSDDGGGPTFDDTLRPLLPPGEYSASCVRVRRYRDHRFNRNVIVLEFAVAEGEYGGAKLDRFYRQSLDVRRIESRDRVERHVEIQPTERQLDFVLGTEFWPG